MSAVRLSVAPDKRSVMSNSKYCMCHWSLIGVAILKGPCQKRRELEPCKPRLIPAQAGWDPLYRGVPHKVIMQTRSTSERRLVVKTLKTY